MQTGIELIANERKEQIEKHGINILDDVTTNNHYQLSQAAGILCIDDMADMHTDPEDHCPSGWNEARYTKMCEKPYKERLIIAGALIAAEIDRLNYLGL